LSITSTVEPFLLQEIMHKYSVANIVIVQKYYIIINIFVRFCLTKIKEKYYNYITLVNVLYKVSRDLRRQQLFHCGMTCSEAAASHIGGYINC